LLDDNQSIVLTWCAQEETEAETKDDTPEESEESEDADEDADEEEEEEEEEEEDDEEEIVDPKDQLEEGLSNPDMMKHLLRSGWSSLVKRQFQSEQNGEYEGQFMLINVLLQIARTQRSATASSTTSTSASNASSSRRRARAVPRRTALRSVCATNSYKRTLSTVSNPSHIQHLSPSLLFDFLLTRGRRAIVFHLAHCATACAAPKLWSKLK
jgi:hypothetical protein